MAYEFEKKIEDFSEDIFGDLGSAMLTEDDKADVYARVQDRLHRVILFELQPLLSGAEMGSIRSAIEQEDYYALDAILEKYPEYKNTLETKIDEDLQGLKSTITEEQRNAGTV